MIEFIHECNVCRGRFTDEELLRTHVCPAAPGNEYIELNGVDDQTATDGPERYEETAPEAGTTQQDRLGILTPENGG